VALLNAHPLSTKAETYLIENNLIDPLQKETEMAKFLWCQADAVQKYASWERISNRNHVATLRASVNLVDFSKPLHYCLKEFYSKFRPVGDRQFDNVQEIFSEEYYRANPQLFPNADAASVVCHGILYLIVWMGRKTPPSKEEFIKQMQMHTDNAIDVTWLEQIYDDLEKNRHVTFL
jgi:Sec7-like guanine-nucleotide exchange factor